MRKRTRQEHPSHRAHDEPPRKRMQHVRNTLLQERIQDQNRTTSPFLRLPQELRDIIYEFALGNQTIHVGTRDCALRERGSWISSDEDWTSPQDTPSAKKFTHAVCCMSMDSEERAHELSDDPIHAAMLQPYSTRHRLCYNVMESLKVRYLMQSGERHGHVLLAPPRSPFTPGRMLSKEQDWLRDHNLLLPGESDWQHPWRRHRGSALRLDLLRVCHQVHHEAALIPYALNTFAFTDGKDLGLFFSKTLRPSQRKAVQRLQIGPDKSGCYGEPSGIRASTRNALPIMENLTYLEVSAWSYSKLYGGLASLLSVPLKSVRIFVEGEYHDAEQRRAIAIKIEKSLKHAC